MKMRNQNIYARSNFIVYKADFGTKNGPNCPTL